MEIKRVALIGLGAIGAFVATSLQELLGDEGFYIIAGSNRREKLEKGIKVNGKMYYFRCVDPNEEGEKADLVIVATKFNGLEGAIKDISSQVGEHTVIISLLNGVTSEEQLMEVYGERVIYALTRASVVRTEEEVLFDKAHAYLEFGEAINNTYSERILAIKDLFDKAGIAYKIPQDMKRAIWLKYACNIAENQSSAILGIPFGAWHVSEHANLIREAAMKEVFAVAEKKGIHFGEEEFLLQRENLKRIPYENKTSMFQDIENGRATEVEMFAGTMIKMGKEFNVDTPVNELFYHALYVLEEKNSKKI